MKIARPVAVCGAGAVLEVGADTRAGVRRDVDEPSLALVRFLSRETNALVDAFHAENGRERLGVLEVRDEDDRVVRVGLGIDEREDFLRFRRAAVFAPQELVALDRAPQDRRDDFRALDGAVGARGEDDIRLHPALVEMKLERGSQLFHIGATGSAEAEGAFVVIAMTNDRQVFHLVLLSYAS